MRVLLNTCIVLLIMNIGILFMVYDVGSNADSREAAQSLGRVISAYSEPNSSPQFLVNAENQCRFWGDTYCARAQAKRKSIVLAQPLRPALPADIQKSSVYTAYLNTRAALTQATGDYVEFLSKDSTEEQFVARSKEFEEQSNVLVGQLISYLYDMQRTLIQQENSTQQRVLMGQYACLVFVLFLLSVLRFRRGGFHDRRS